MFPLPKVGRSKFLPLLSTLVLLLSVLTGVVLVQRQQELRSKAAGATWYVSKKGNNADGRSWTTAWNELDRINWSAIRPGDTILIDGGTTACPTLGANYSGSSCGMVYESTLTVGKSGQSGKPITIRMASESGRDGTIIIFGGRPKLLPSCDRRSFDAPEGRGKGLSFNGQSWVTIDGIKWSGIAIYGHSGSVKVNGANNILRNAEIYDNGFVYFRSNGEMVTSAPGVRLEGSNILLERLKIHDNGQDAIQGKKRISNIILRQSWLYNGRWVPGRPGHSVASSCTHTDGWQIFDGGVMSGVLIEDSVFGPGFTQGTILGQSLASGGQYAEINDVTIRNTLFINASGTNIMGYPNVKEKNWKLDRVTSYLTNRNLGGDSHRAVELFGSGHSVIDSVFYGGNIFLEGAETAGNCEWNTVGHGVGQDVDPQFTTDVSSYPDDVALSTLINTNFALKPGSPCTGKGSNITSVAQLLGQTPPSPSPSTPTPTSKFTPTPSPSSTLTPTPIPGCNVSTSSWQNFSLPSQTGTFSVQFDATPNSQGINALTALSSVAGSTFDDYAAIVRFNTGGTIDVRNGGTYTADTQISYNAGTSYHFRVDVNIPAHTYSVWVTPEGGNTQKLATDYAFRTPQSGITSVTNWGIWAGTGSSKVCNFILNSTPSPTNTPTLTPLPGDINGDGVVNILDFQILNNNFGTKDVVSDLNGDGIVNILDFQILSNNFGKTSG